VSCAWQFSAASWCAAAAPIEPDDFGLTRDSNPRADISFEATEPVTQVRGLPLAPSSPLATSEAEAASEKSDTSPTPPGSDLNDDFAVFECDRIEAALLTCGGSQSRAAELLSMTHRKLLLRLDTYSFVRPRKSKRP
jgi:DNA-binding NtrC family response regulator